MPRSDIARPLARFAGGLTLFAAIAAGLPALAQDAGQIVRVDSGELRGTPTRQAGVQAFKGIPYAAPPTGKLRWRAPQPPSPWSGIRDASRFGSICPSPNNRANEAMDEDCLFLNVWTGATSPNERRPVMVWFHGGGFYEGSGSDPRTNGEGLAGKGVVLVTFNYRLGPLGFLSTPALSAESGHRASGNYGLLDEIAALRWVRRNIAAFGGDRNNVTVFGHSAGAGSVNFLSVSPLARGLFRRALAESQVRYPRDLELRYLSSSWRPLAAAERAGSDYAAGLGATTPQALRALDWHRFVDGTFVPDLSVETRSSARPPLFRPVVDGWVLPQSFSRTFARGLQNRVQYAAGNNRDEGGAAPETAFAALRAPDRRIPAINIGSPAQIATLVQFQAYAHGKFGPMADEFLRLYPAANDDEAALQNNAAIRDNSQISTYLWARDWKKANRAPLYTYFWTHAPPGPTHDSRGAYHGSEINYVFESMADTPLPWTDEDRRIADLMSSYWVNYAKTGNPNGPGLPHWPAFDPAAHGVMALGDSFAPQPIATGAKFDFWVRFFATNVAW